MTFFLLLVLILSGRSSAVITPQDSDLSELREENVASHIWSSISSPLRRDLSADTTSRSSRIVLTVPFIPKEIPILVDLLLNKWVAVPPCKEMVIRRAKSSAPARLGALVPSSPWVGLGPSGFSAPSSTVLDSAARQRYPSFGWTRGVDEMGRVESGPERDADAAGILMDTSLDPLSLAAKRTTFDLLFFSSVPLPREQYEILDAAARNSSAVQSCFAKSFIIDAGLDKDEDVYPAGPTVMFFKLFLGYVTSLADYGSMFWMEPDVTPLKPFWLGAVAKDAHSAPFSWWMRGSLIQGPSTNRILLAPNAFLAWIKHINGNALYRLDDPTFVNFVQTVLARYSPIDGWKPWDTSFLLERNRSPEDWMMYHQVHHRFVFARFIFNIVNDITPELVARIEHGDLSDVFLVHASNIAKAKRNWGRQYYFDGFPKQPLWQMRQLFENDYLDKLAKYVSERCFGHSSCEPYRLDVFIRTNRSSAHSARQALDLFMRHISIPASPLVVVPDADYADLQDMFPPPMRLNPEIPIAREHHQALLSGLFADQVTSAPFVLHLRPSARVFGALQASHFFHRDVPIARFVRIRAAIEDLELLGLPTLVRSPDILVVFPRSIYAAVHEHLSAHGVSFSDLLDVMHRLQISVEDIMLSVYLFSEITSHLAGSTLEVFPVELAARYAPMLTLPVPVACDIRKDS